MHLYKIRILNIRTLHTNFIKKIDILFLLNINKKELLKKIVY
jgi:hypothetical protein